MMRVEETVKRAQLLKMRHRYLVYWLRMDIGHPAKDGCGGAHPAGVDGCGGAHPAGVDGC